MVYPVSKLLTANYLFKYKEIETSVYSIYRYLDKLHKEQMEAIKAISFRHTLTLFHDTLLPVIEHFDGKYSPGRLIVSYKEERERKDAHNRKRGLEKLEKNLNAGKLSKKQINNKC